MSAPDIRRLVAETGSDLVDSDPEAFAAVEAGHLAAAILLQLRESRGLTQQDLADATGRQRSAIARLESGSANPTLRTLIGILAAYGLTFDVIVRPIAESQGVGGVPIRVPEIPELKEYERVLEALRQVSGEPSRFRAAVSDELEEWPVGP